MKKTIRSFLSGFKNKGLLKYILQDPSNIFDGKLIIENNCKIECSKIAGNISIEKNCYIGNSILNGKMKVGEGCRISTSEFYSKKGIEIGNYTSIWGPNISIRQRIYPIKIGNFCSIARGVNIQEYNHNSKKLTSYYIGNNVFRENWENEIISKGPIEIENDVWIGTNALILGGSKIGNGCIVAGNAVINKVYPDYAIIAGVPGKVIGYRFDAETIEYLKELKWWDWSIEKIKEHKSLFMNEFKYKMSK